VGAYKYLFGPVPSRRFGRSLGIDLTPFKTCSLDCVFCQLGRTTHKTKSRAEYVPVKDVLREFDHWLAHDGQADYVTLSGSGEPTLHSKFGEVIEHVRKTTDIPVLLLTNGTLLHLPEVREAACRANVVKASLSAWDQRSFVLINRPCADVSFTQLIEGEQTFAEEFDGRFLLEVFVLWGINSVPADLGRIAELACRIRPNRVQLNTAVRPPAEDFVLALPMNRMHEVAKLFDPPAEVIAEFHSHDSGVAQVNESTVLAMLKRRSCTAEQIAQAFGMHRNEVAKYIGKLVRTREAYAVKQDKNIYYGVPRDSEVDHARLQT